VYTEILRLTATDWSKGEETERREGAVWGPSLWALAVGPRWGPSLGAVSSVTCDLVNCPLSNLSNQATRQCSLNRLLPVCFLHIYSLCFYSLSLHHHLHTYTHTHTHTHTHTKQLTTPVRKAPSLAATGLSGTGGERRT